MHRGVSVAGLQTLGAPMTIDVAREVDALGYDSLWVAEANAAESMSLLGALTQAAPHVAVGTGVIALQLRTPPLAAMAAATLQQLAGERDVWLGVGISSPAVAGQWPAHTISRDYFPLRHPKVGARKPCPPASSVHPWAASAVRPAMPTARRCSRSA